MALETFLTTDLLENFDSQNYKNFKGVKAPTESSDSVSFDLLDKVIPFIVEEGTGSVTYKNPQKKKIYVTNYEEFINSIPKNLQIGKKRCDFIVYQEDDNLFFILNELSQSRNIDSKESDALYQLQNSLQNLTSVSSIKSKINSCAQKLCIFSNIVKRIDSPLGMANGFNETFMTMQQYAVPFDYDGINGFGFVYYRANFVEITDILTLKNIRKSAEVK